MPNALLEAMAAGRPVVAADVEGVGEALGPEKRPSWWRTAIRKPLLTSGSLLTRPDEGRRLARPTSAGYAHIAASSPRLAPMSGCSSRSPAGAILRRSPPRLPAAKNFF